MPQFGNQTCTLHYEDVGEGLPALVFLHGWCDSSAVWHEVIAEFSKERRCIAPDMRGHGQSSFAYDHAYFPEALSSDVVALCRSLGLDKPIVVGHSFGGFLAAEIARRFPDFARAAVIVDQPLDLAGLHAQLAPLEEVIRSPEQHLAFRDQFLDSLVTPLMRPEWRQSLAEQKMSTPIEIGQAFWAVLFESTTDELHDRGDADMAALATLPVMVLDGQEPEGYYAELRQAAPGIDIRTLDCGHWVQLERPAEFNAALREFVARVV
jgi:pimeloyl-ACP methyl ester carboxylesterase